PANKLGAEGACTLRSPAYYQQLLGRLSDPAFFRGAAGRSRTDPALRDRSGRRGRSRARSGHRRDRQCRLRLPWRARPQPADHARQPDRGSGALFGNNRNTVSGGAAHGLVASLTPAFKGKTGIDIKGEFGAVGGMADKLRNGVAADIIILPAALVAKLAD